MKILVITPTYFPVMGGAEMGIYEIFSRLSLRHEVRILTPRLTEKQSENYGREDAEARPAGSLEVIHFKDRLNLDYPPVQWRSKGLIPPFSLSCVRAALDVIRGGRPDIVNVFYAVPTGLAGAVIKKKCRLPVVLSLIGRDIPGPGIPVFWKNHVRRTARWVSEVIFISGYGRTAVFGPRSREGTVIPFGVDTDRFRPDIDGRPVREALGIPSGALALFALQRLDRWKRADVLVRAMKILTGRIDAYLVIGGKGPEKGPLTDLARSLGISSRIIFAGYVPESDLPAYYSMADIFAFHSTYETFGVVLVQAMAAGKPVVSADSTAIPELIENGVNGLLVPALDEKAFAEAVLSLHADRSTLKRFSVESRKRAVEKFQWDRIATQYEDVFLGCLGSA